MKRAALLRPRTRPVVSSPLPPPPLYPRAAHLRVGSHIVNTIVIIAIINAKEVSLSRCYGQGFGFLLYWYFFKEGLKFTNSKILTKQAAMKMTFVS